MNLSDKTFEELMNGLRGPSYEPPQSLLSIDPGETMGVALFSFGTLQFSSEISCKDYPHLGPIQCLGIHFLRILEQYRPTRVIIEDYRVYEQKAKSHSWNALHTPRLIGALQMLCYLKEVPFTMQMASSKQFCTNSKLERWGFHKKGKPHASDAIRHGCYYLLFNKEG